MHLSAQSGMRSSLIRAILRVLALGAVAVTGRVEAQVGSVATSAPVLSSVASWNAHASAPPGTGANSLTILITSGGIQTLPNLTTNSINTFPTPVRITTQWDISVFVANVDLIGYFATPASALSNGWTNLPSSRMQGRMTSGRIANFTPFTSAPVGGVGTPGGSLHLFRQFVIGFLNGLGSRTDNLDLRLDLTGLPSLEPGVYQGTLILRAVVQ